MKKIILLLIGTIIGLSTYAQLYIDNKITNLEKIELTPNYYWDTIIVYDTGEISQRHTQQINWTFYKPEVIKIEIIKNNIWKDSVKLTYDYDYLGNVIKESRYVFDITWKEETSKWNYYTNNLIDSTIYTYLQNLNSLYKYHYYTNGDLYQMESFYRIQNNWVLSSKTTYMTYTTNHNILTYETEFSNEKFYGEYSYILSPYGEKYYAHLVKKFNNGVYINYNLFEYIYDFNYNIKEHYYRNWINNSWINNQGGYAIFNSNNDRINYTWRIWSDGQWVDKYRLITEYDNNHNSIGQYCEITDSTGNWINGEWGLMLNCDKNWYYLNAFGNHHRFESSFFPLYVGVDELSNSFRYYPNPTTGYVYFDKQHENIKIYSVYGVKLKELNDTEKIDLFEYNSGVYIININNKSKIKIIKQ